MIMKVTIAAIGKDKHASPTDNLFKEYKKRTPWIIDLKEFEESNRLGFEPSATVAKVRLSPETGEFEKEVIRTVKVLGYEMPRLPIWIKLEGAE